MKTTPILKGLTKATLVVLFSFLSSFVKSQKKLPSIEMREVTSAITIDGELNEEGWQNLPLANDFYQSVPFDTSYAKTKTEVKITYDKKFIYIGAVCYDDLDGDYIIQSLKRDFSYPISDAFGIYLDPFDDHQNGFSFAVNPKGVQREGLLQDGGIYGVSTSWDNYWFSEVKTYPNKWVVEIAIPFTSIRFKPGTTKWRINFSRNDLKRNEGSSWAYVPRNFNIATLSYCGELLWDKPVKKAARNIAIIPYVTGATRTDYEGEDETTYNANIGTDAKIGISSSLQLDLTVNPDFSQVEVDRQVTNLSRFSLFFPERRNFFIENSDLFSNFGFRNIRPFFSRKIGLNNGQIVPILAGARLSGKIGNDWRIGVMNIQTEGNEANTPQNYSVLALQKTVLKNSNIGFIGLNRLAFDHTTPTYDNFNRILGVDFNYASEDRKWLGKVFYHHSFAPNIGNNNFTHASFARYNDKNWVFMWNHEYVGNNYTADFGFVPRQTRFNPDLGIQEKRTFWRIEPEIGYTFFPKKSERYLNQKVFLYMDQYLDSKGETTDNLIRLQYGLTLKNTSSLNIFLKQNFTKLFFNTDVSFSGQTPISNGDYNYVDGYIEYTSNRRKKLFFNAFTGYGEYYNGNRISYGAEVNYRLQPIGKFSLGIRQNSIHLPQLDKPVDLTLVSATAELSFTKSIFFTTFFQYNTQIQNFNINSRLQWRFKPMSDLYLVYTENYLTTNTSIKNRGLVLKFVYWLQ